MWTQLFESQWLFGGTPFEWGAAVLCCAGAAYLSYLAANILRVVRETQKRRRR